MDRYYVVADDGVVQAYGGLWIAAPDADVQTIAVAPGAQGRGLGAGYSTTCWSMLDRTDADASSLR